MNVRKESGIEEGVDDLEKAGVDWNRSRIVRNDTIIVSKASRTVRNESRTVKKLFGTVRRDSRSLRKESKTAWKKSGNV